MMMHEDQTAATLPGTFQAKPAEPAFEFNSQGERILVERPAESVSSVSPTEIVPEIEEEDFVELWDTPLAIPEDAFWPADTTDVVHEVISCGHVLKSTHDLARWSEKTGARRVNSEEAIDAITDLAVNLEIRPITKPKGGNKQKKPQQKKPQQKSQIINSWPVLKSTHDLATWSEKSGANRVNGAEASQSLDDLAANSTISTSKIISSGPVLKSTHDMATWSEKRGAKAVNATLASQILEEVAKNGQGGRPQRNGRGRRNTNKAPTQPSQIVNSWPVLKSTHDLAAWSEKRGAKAVNSAGAVGMFEEVAKNQRAVQAGGGGSLQSGLDTQAGSHVQIEGSQKISETPEQAMAELHLHV